MGPRNTRLESAYRTATKLVAATSDEEPTRSAIRAPLPSVTPCYGAVSVNAEDVSPSRNGALRPARESDIEPLIALRERVFGRRLSVEAWRWKLGRRGCDVENIWVVEEDGRIIFQYAGIPTLVRPNEFALPPTAERPQRTIT